VAAQPPIGETVVRVGMLAAVPWANGGGTTRVIVDRPGAFRLSLATIAAAGPFSRLPGMARQFALVAGRVDLGGAVTLSLDVLGAPIAFAGDDPIDAVPTHGPALALNLMVPDSAPALRLERRDHGLVEGALAVFACDPVVVRGAARIELAAHDTLLPQGPVHLAGRALVVRP
jgi:uncharacterized protein